MNITISLPDDLGNWFENWCNKKGHKKSTYIAFLIEAKKMAEEDAPVTPVKGGGGYITTYKGPVKGGLYDPETYKKAVNSPASSKDKGYPDLVNGYPACPHGIILGGRCGNCGGTAKR